MFESLETLNGIKRGSIISPVLFTIYMENLLYILEKNGAGCRIGDHCYEFNAPGNNDIITTLCGTLRKDFVMLLLYWWGCLVAQNTVAEIWSNAW